MSALLAVAIRFFFASFALASNSFCSRFALSSCVSSWDSVALPFLSFLPFLPFDDDDDDEPDDSDFFFFLSFDFFAFAFFFFFWSFLPFFS